MMTDPTHLLQSALTNLQAAFHDILLLTFHFSNYIIISGALLALVALYYGMIIITNKKDPVKAFKRLEALPFGKRVFTFAVTSYAPYSGMLQMFFRGENILTIIM